MLGNVGGRQLLHIFELSAVQNNPASIRKSAVEQDCVQDVSARYAQTLDHHPNFLGCLRLARTRPRHSSP